MLTLGQSLIGKKILSLRIGRPIGIAGDPIINPNNLKIEGWHAQELDTKQTVVLLSQDIRDILPQGFVVNDHDALTNPQELIRLSEILKHNFTVIDKTIVTNNRRRLGKVTDYTFEKNGFYIQKLYVSQSLIKSFTGGALMIDRSQIIEITNKKIVVKEATVEDAAPMPAVA
jgi:uncharacterized protein YrrD